MRLSHIAPVLLVFSSSALAFSPIFANFKRADVRLGKSMQAKWSMASKHQESTDVGVDGLHALNRRDMGKMMAGLLVGGTLDTCQRRPRLETSRLSCCLLARTPVLGLAPHLQVGRTRTHGIMNCALTLPGRLLCEEHRQSIIRTLRKKILPTHC
jgi:hypothetical protein